jgi:hypothetical protein
VHSRWGEFDGDSTFLFDVHTVKELVVVKFADGSGDFEHSVGEGRFPVVDMGDDAKVADIHKGEEQKSKFLQREYKKVALKNNPRFFVCYYLENSHEIDMLHTMFYLRQENYDPKYPKFRVMKAQKEFGIQNYLLYENLSTIIEMSMGYPKYHHIFLLDDQRFHFFSFDVTMYFEEKITLSDLQRLINEKIALAEKETKEEYLFSHLENVFVDGVPKKFLIGEKGEIQCRIILVYLNRQTCLEFNDKYGNFHNQKNLKLMPESFQTIAYLKNTVKNDSFLLLYIRDSHCKGVLVEHGFYKRIESINLGVNALMQMYKDNGISKYRYKQYEEIENNPFAKNLVIQTLEFYSQMLCKWIEEEQI